jgi:hypothetical protein
VRFLTGRFSALLIALFLLFLLHVFLAGHPLTQNALPVFLFVILLANVHALGDNKIVSLIASLLGLAALALRWAMYASESHVLLLISEGVGTLFFAFTTVTILTMVLRTQTVTGDTVSGALCVYLLMGLMWAFLYMLVESVHPGTFRFAVEMKIAGDAAYPPPAFLSRFIYLRPDRGRGTGGASLLSPASRAGHRPRG